MKSNIVSILLLFVVLTIQPLICNDLIFRINPNHILQAQENVRIELRNHFWYQIAAGAGVGSVIGVSLYFFFSSRKEISPIPIKVGYLTEMDVSNLRACLDKIVPALGAKLQNDNSWFNWFKQSIYSNTQTVLTGVVYMGIFNFFSNTLGPISKYITKLDGLLDRSVSSFFHKNTIEWFIKSHVNLTEVFNSLELNAAIIEGRPIQIPANSLTDVATTISGAVAGRQAQKDAVDSLEGNWNIFVQQLEQVLGFIEYKRAVHYNPLEAERMQAIGAKIIDLVNSFATELGQKIIGSENNGTLLIYEDLRTLRANIGQELSNFSVLESFKRIDLVNEAVKQSDNKL
jgi:hypothetical protein